MRAGDELGQHVLTSQVVCDRGVAAGRRALYDFDPVIPLPRKSMPHEALRPLPQELLQCPTMFPQ